MPRNVTIASLQINTRDLPRPTTSEANRLLCAEAIDEAAGRGADVVVFPECCTSQGVSGDDVNRVEPLDGPSFRLWSERAKRHGINVIGWQFEQAPEGVYNTGVFIGRDGKLIGTYRKVHITPLAARGGRLAGDEFPLLEMDFGTVGMMICYDAYFPEHARILALKGAEVIFYPTMSDARGEAIWELVARARAVDNAVFVVSAVMRNSYQCYSAIFAPNGRVFASNPTWDAGLVVGTIDLDHRLRSEGHSGISEPAYLRELYRFSRRPELYGEISSIRHELTINDVRADD
ncbi:MAG: carbon-nitrogen hydrolase family protein [Armatimonadota bacterium]|jgi:predicted amidohydrolase